MVCYRGLLSGKYRRGEAVPSAGRVSLALGNEAYPSQDNLNDKYWALMQVIHKIAEEQGIHVKDNLISMKTWSLLNYLLQKSLMTSYWLDQIIYRCVL